ncbi:MAG: right-handed parallel beta-helix repeat-containing protein [Candidatus Thorarchaeota archaeon]|nr:right-handed parallel beta-helix repeat-containing protein [Candidatus Thorarchaeota archaeon]
MRGKSKAFLCIIIIAVLATIPAPVVECTELIEESRYIAQAVLDDSYTKHEVIAICNNSDFSGQDWPGSGSFDDPYVLEGLNITDNATGISIKNTTVYFEIRNCIVSSVNPSSSHGIMFHNVTNGVVQDCRVTRHSRGVYLSNSTSCRLSNNTAIDNLGVGLYLKDSSSCILTGNLASNNSVDDIYAIGGIYLENTNDTVLSNNRASTNDGRGVYLRSSYGCKLTHNTVHANYFSGFFVVLSDNCNLTNNIAFNNSVDDFYSYGGFYISNAHHNRLANNTSYNNSGPGFTLERANNSTLRNNTARGGYKGFHIITSEDCLVSGNEAFSNGAGFLLWYSSHNEITMNTASNNSGDGFLLRPSSSCLLTHNVATGNERGVYLHQNSKNNLLYGNRLGYNTEINGLDNGGPNAWDNGTHGNYWSDYAGGDSYSVPGPGNSTDNHPYLLDLIPPRIDHPSDITYLARATGNNITWHPSDTNPQSFEVYRNGSLIESSPWNGSSILINIDGLHPGTYNFTIVVYDQGDNSVHDTVIVTVVPRTIETVILTAGLLMGVVIAVLVIIEFKEIREKNDPFG